MNDNRMDITVSNHNDTAYEKLFDDLMQEVFGFSFAPWFARKLWNEQYESYSIIKDGHMLSNVCVFKTDMLVQGKAFRAHQFGGVATRLSERGKGYARLLMEYALAQYLDTPAFLFANPSVVDFYPRFGFRQVQTHRPSITVAINNKTSGAVKHSNDSAPLLQSLYQERIYSDQVDCLNIQSVQIFHLLLEYADGIYYLPESKAFVVAEQDGHDLFIADVITQNRITFDAIKAELPFSDVESVAFGFCPEWLGVVPDWEPIAMSKDPFFLYGNWDLPEKYRFPSMSVT